MADSVNPDQLSLVQGLFVQHLPALRGFVLSLVSDYSLVDDVVQETFLVVSAKAGQFQRGSNFRAWAWTIARYKVLQTLQKVPKAEQRLSDEVIESLCATEASEEWPAEDQLRQLAECVRELAPKARQAVELRYQQAHKPPEIARLMGWTVDAVHVALSRARVALRDCVQRRTVRT